MNRPSVLNKIIENIEGITLAVVSTWGSSGAFVFQNHMENR